MARFNKKFSMLIILLDDRMKINGHGIAILFKILQKNSFLRIRKRNFLICKICTKEKV